MKADKDRLEKIPADAVVGPSIIFTRKAVADETFNPKSEKECKPIAGIDANQLYPCYVC